MRDRPGVETRLGRWERRAEVPMLLLALAFLVAYAWPALDPRLDATTLRWLGVVAWVVWAVFAVDLVVRVWLADHRVRYLLTHWYDVVLVLLPALRPLRLLRVLAFARLVKRSAVGGIAGRVSIYVGGTAIGAVGLGALAVLRAERGAPGANIETAGDALWWAVTTVTTVGYGDYYPVTTAGRLVAVGLMVIGIGVVGSLTAAVASRLLDLARRERRSRQVDTGDDRVVSVSGEVHAPAGHVFDLIADPASQPLWDANHNLALAEAGQRVRRVGDVFTMRLVGGAVRENHVVELEEGRRIAWLPSEVGAEPPGHLWRWEVEPTGGFRCQVTHTYDWTRLTDPSRIARAEATDDDVLRASLERLADLAERG